MGDTTLDLGALDEEPRPGAVLRAPRRRWRPDLQGWSIDRVLLAVAVLLLPGGVAAILLGWYGAARTPFIFEQVPYLISGGLLGVGLLTAGGLLYMGSWLSRLAEQQRADAAQLREVLAGLGAAPAEPAVAPATALVATPTGTMFHRPDCAVVAGRDDLRTVTGSTNGLRPCKLCEPAAA